MPAELTTTRTPRSARLTRRTPRGLATAGLVAVCAALVTLGACSSSGPDRAADIDEVQQALVKADIACHGRSKPYVRSETQVDLGVEPTRTLECTVNGVDVQATQFASQAEREKALVAAHQLLCQFGGSAFSYVVHGAWMVTAERPRTNTTDTKMIARIADATGGTVEKADCDDKAPGGNGKPGPTATPGHSGVPGGPGTSVAAHDGHPTGP